MRWYLTCLPVRVMGRITFLQDPHSVDRAEIVGVSNSFIVWRMCPLSVNLPRCYGMFKIYLTRHMPFTRLRLL